MNTESGSQRLIYNLLGLAFASAIIFRGSLVASWPQDGEFLWKLGFAVGNMPIWAQLLFALCVLCLVGAGALQFIRVLFRTSRR